MRRSLLAVLAAVSGLVPLASPASAGETTDVLVAYEDGSVEVREVPVATAGSAIAAAERDDEVAYAELDVPLQAAVTPNDPLFGQQWGPTKVGAPAAWDRTTGSSDVVIAVVDTGVDGSHPDLVGNVLPGVDCISDPGNCRPESPVDPGGHGTGVAGVIAAKGNDSTGMAGYCWGCKILPVRALNGQGSGSAATVGNGIRWAADNGADIINLSLAGDETNNFLNDSITYARQRGVVVIAAAGNQTRLGQDLTKVQYPAASPGVLSVVATDQNDAIYGWSFRGTWADVAAPGCVVATAPGARYQNECGTSFASPAVAGILGLAMSAFPAAPDANIEALLASSSRGISGGLAAAGRVDATALLDALALVYAPVAAAERVAGADRVSTAVALSQKAFASATSVIVARSDNYADALAAAPLAGKLGAPVLLTPAGDLAANVAAEVRRLGATSAVLVGGTGALSPAVEGSLASLGAAPRRIAGVSRYETAALLAIEVGGTSVFVTQAGAWPDAVAVSGLAALTRRPILLVDRDSVPTVTSQALAQLGASTVTVVGGPGVVSDGVASALGAAGRLAGANRYETSKVIAEVAAASGASSATTWIATGSDWPDALAAGPAAADEGAVLQLVDGKGGAPAGLVGGVRELLVVGGEASVTGTVLGVLSGLLG